MIYNTMLSTFKLHSINHYNNFNFLLYVINVHIYIYIYMRHIPLDIINIILY